jgi:hypothetical protein
LGRPTATAQPRPTPTRPPFVPCSYAATPCQPPPAPAGRPDPLPPNFSSPTRRRAVGPPSLLFPHALSRPPLPFPFAPLSTPPHSPCFPSFVPTSHTPPSAQIATAAAFFPSAESSTSTAVKHHRAAPFSPPSSTHRHSELVSILLARRLTRDSVKLAPTTSEHLGRQATPGHRATLPVAGVVTVSWRLGRVGYFGSRIGPARPGPHGLSACWPTRATSPWEQRPRANFSLSTVPSFFYYPNLFSNLNIHRNSVILLKYIENGLNLRKI